MNSQIVSDILVPITLAITTLGMGLSLEKSDFRHIFARPKALSTAIISKIILLPAIAFTLSVLFNIRPEFKVGLILIAACPGGATTNLLTYLLRGNLALSIAMTAISSFIILFSLPFTVNLGLAFFIGKKEIITLPFFNTIINVFLLTILPTIIGINLRAKYLNFTQSLEKPLRIILPVLLLIVFSLILVTESKQDDSSLLESFIVFPVGLLLNLSGMLMGYYIAKIIKLSKKNTFTIAIEVGLQNTALAIFIGSTLLNNSKIALVAVIYSSFTFFSTALFGYLIKKHG